MTTRLVFGSPRANKLVELNKKLEMMSDAEKALHSPAALEARYRAISKDIDDTERKLERLRIELLQVGAEIHEWRLP